MSRKPLRRRSTPTPAQSWRILHATAREARIARRELAAERRRIARQEARREAQRQQEAVELDRRFREAEGAGCYRIRAVSGSAKLVNSPGFEPRVF